MGSYISLESEKYYESILSKIEKVGYSPFHDIAPYGAMIFYSSFKEL